MLSMKSLSDAVRFVSHASALKDVRYYLNGVAFEFRRQVHSGDTPDATSDTLYVLGTDGHRVARVTLALGPDDLPALDRKADALIIDTEAVAAILAVKKPSDNMPVDLRLTTVEGSKAKFLTMDSGAFSVRCSLIDGKYPDWRRIFPNRTEIEEGTQNIAYIDSTYIGEACDAIAKLHKSAGNKYRPLSLAVHSDTTIVTAPGFSCGQVSDPLVKIMHMRR